MKNTGFIVDASQRRRPHQQRVRAADPTKRSDCCRKSLGLTGTSTGSSNRPQDPMSWRSRSMRHSRVSVATLDT